MNNYTSVCIPCHNDFDLLLKVIDNLYEGVDISEFEIIVVNDGSVYDSGQFNYLVLDANKYPNVTVINNVIQQGVGYSFDRAVERAKGDIIILMGSDVFPRKRSWLTDVKNTCLEYPDTIGCSVCLGLSPDNLDLDTDKTKRRYGANLLIQVGVDDLPEHSKLKKDRPDYTALFEAQWAERKNTDNPYKIPCALGAFYFTSKAYYTKIGGWDTKSGKANIGHSLWGSLEPYISLKSWLCGGGVTLYPHIETGHIFGRLKRGNFFHKRASRPDRHWWNRLFIAETMIFDDELRERIVSFAKPELNLGKAKKAIRTNYSNVLEVREANKLRFVNSFEYICHIFDIKIK